jgi:DNA-3-methyladenine glycosylase I
MEYHDTKWGIPCHDERELFKMLILEGQQAGLSWLTILRKTDSLSAAYDNFDPEKMAKYGERKIASLMENPGVIRNRLKIMTAVTNARAYLALKNEHGSLDKFLWSYVDNRPIVNNWKPEEKLPASTPLSDTISRELKKRGFKFVGSTIIYSFLQAVGLINDHVAGCAFKKADS